MWQEVSGAPLGAQVGEREGHGQLWGSFSFLSLQWKTAGPLWPATPIPTAAMAAPVQEWDPGSRDRSMGEDGGAACLAKPSVLICKMGTVEGPPTPATPRIIERSEQGIRGESTPRAIEVPPNKVCVIFTNPCPKWG